MSTEPESTEARLRAVDAAMNEASKKLVEDLADHVRSVSDQVRFFLRRAENEIALRQAPIRIGGGTPRGTQPMSDDQKSPPNWPGACQCGSTSCGWGSGPETMPTMFGTWTRTEPHTCWCASCNPCAWWMVTCALCGDKRCPKAMSHERQCAREVA